MNLDPVGRLMPVSSMMAYLSASLVSPNRNLPRYTRRVAPLLCEAAVVAPLTPDAPRVTVSTPVPTPITFISSSPTDTKWERTKPDVDATGIVVVVELTPDERVVDAPLSLVPKAMSPRPFI